MNHVFYSDVDLLIDEDRKEIIINPKGEQTLYTEHKAMGLDYEKLLCLHPKELIRKKSFFGMSWYNVCGVLKREVRSIYLCLHKEYRIHERCAVLSHTYEER